MEPKKLPHFYIVGIGASAGGSGAIESFFDNMPPNSGLAFVVIQHLSPDYKSMMVEILSKHTDMPVVEAINEVRVEPNHIYLIPRKKYLSLSGEQLYLTEKDSSTQLSLPIDIFFHSLAKELGQYAVAIILSGTGSDGTRGIRTIKESHGMIMTQKPDSAQFDGMPRNAIATGLVDYILPVEQMPEALLNFVQHPQVLTDKSLETNRLSLTDHTLDQILEAIRELTDVDFADYKKNTILRRIERRMSVNQLEKLTDYLRYLYQDPEEVKVLYKELLIGVTQFFRDHQMFEVLCDTVLPQIFERSQGSIRIWVAGCSTGEEAYSFAILFAEFLDKMASRQLVQIFATDIDNTAIDFASAGIYPDSIIADVSVERLERFFIKKDEHYEVNQRLRKMVIFAPHDLIKNPPFSKIDLLSCRNLFIYLQSSLQEKILRFFHFSLKPEGFLFLGSSESVNETITLFNCLDSKNKIYQCKTDYNSTVRQLNLETSTIINVPKLPVFEVGKRATLPLSVYKFDEILYQALTAEYIPPSVIIDENFEVLHIHGDLSEYLRLPQGRTSLNLSKMLHKEIAALFKMAIHNAMKKNKRVTYGIQIPSRPKGQKVNLHVKPLVHHKLNDSPWLVITFEEVGFYENEPSEHVEIDVNSEQRIIGLENELQDTRETLQVALEEVETSNEEMQATNEELLASNEELQSTNEELQAVNEELITVNAEHQRKIQELTDLNDDVNNLLRSTHIGTVFLDSSLRIKRFTPELTKEINIIDSDLGRPFEHITHNLKYDHFMEDIETVLLGHGVKKIKVANKTGNWYLLQISPYITAERAVQGVVVTLVNYEQGNQLKKK